MRPLGYSKNLLQERAKIVELDARVVEQKEQLGRMGMMLQTLVRHSLQRSQSASQTRCWNDTGMLEESSSGGILLVSPFIIVEIYSTVQ